MKGWGHKVIWTKPPKELGTEIQCGRYLWRIGLDQSPGDQTRYTVLSIPFTQLRERWTKAVRPAGTRTQPLSPIIVDKITN
jgi:hypothetical protein